MDSGSSQIPETSRLYKAISGKAFSALWTSARGLQSHRETRAAGGAVPLCLRHPWSWTPRQSLSEALCFRSTTDDGYAVLTLARECGPFCTVSGHPLRARFSLRRENKNLKQCNYSLHFLPLSDPTVPWQLESLRYSPSPCHSAPPLPLPPLLTLACDSSNVIDHMEPSNTGE